MGKLKDIEDFKNDEFLGDKLLNLIVSDIIITEKKLSRSFTTLSISRFTRNSYLAIVFDKLGLEFNPNDIGFSDKKKANTVEAYVWNYFIENGYEETKIFYRPFVLENLK